MKPLRVFIGWDSREIDAYRVAVHSLVRHASIELEIHPLKQDVLRRDGLYWRDVDETVSTEFTYTRFLAPYLAGFDGLTLFFDCDFLWRTDVAKLLAEAEPGAAVWCVKHDYRPSEATKMDGQPQMVYPRKNWSSLMLFDASHPATKRLSLEYVNTASPAALHRFRWANDNEIGTLSTAWNYLEGWHKRTEVEPNAVHFTRGGPWFQNWQNVEFAEEWRAELGKAIQESD